MEHGRLDGHTLARVEHKHLLQRNDRQTDSRRVSETIGEVCVCICGDTEQQVVGHVAIDDVSILIARRSLPALWTIVYYLCMCASVCMAYTP